MSEWALTPHSTQLGKRTKPFLGGVPPSNSLFVYADTYTQSTKNSFAPVVGGLRSKKPPLWLRQYWTDNGLCRSRNRSRVLNPSTHATRQSTTGINSSL